MGIMSKKRCDAKKQLISMGHSDMLYCNRFVGHKGKHKAYFTDYDEEWEE